MFLSQKPSYRPQVTQLLHTDQFQAQAIFNKEWRVKDKERLITMKGSSAFFHLTKLDLMTNKTSSDISQNHENK